MARKATMIDNRIVKQYLRALRSHYRAADLDITIQSSDENIYDREIRHKLLSHKIADYYGTSADCSYASDSSKDPIAFMNMIDLLETLDYISAEACAEARGVKLRMGQVYCRALKNFNDAIMFGLETGTLTPIEMHPSALAEEAETMAKIETPKDFVEFTDEQKAALRKASMKSFEAYEQVMAEINMNRETQIGGGLPTMTPRHCNTDPVVTPSAETKLVIKQALKEIEINDLPIHDGKTDYIKTDKHAYLKDCI